MGHKRGAMISKWRLANGRAALRGIGGARTIRMALLSGASEHIGREIPPAISIRQNSCRPIKLNFRVPRWPISVFPELHVGRAGIVTVLIVEAAAIEHQHTVGVLFDRTGFAKIAQHGNGRIPLGDI